MLLLRQEVFILIGILLKIAFGKKGCRVSVDSIRKPYDLIVIGAGAAGLTAAAEAGKNGKKVLVVDHNASPVQKVLISGGGKCNFSNKFVSADRYVSTNPHFCKSALAGFGWQNMTKELDQKGIRWEEREDGKLFAFSSRDICRFLVERAQGHGAGFLFNVSNFDLRKNDLFCLRCDAGTFESKNLLIATGGLSYPAVGAGDIGYRLAQRFGLKVIPPHPALVALDFAEKMCPDFNGLAGISLRARVKTAKTVKEGMLLFTNRGISGPVVLQTSLYWNEGQPIEIDFLPYTNVSEELKQRRRSKEKKKIKNVLADYLPVRLADRFAALLNEADQNASLTALSDKSFFLLNEKIKKCCFVPLKTAGWDNAEVTKGGVDVNALSSATLECRSVQGLFFAGEVLDVTGELGGFNLHWAWASGSAAGKAIAKKES